MLNTPHLSVVGGSIQLSLLPPSGKEKQRKPKEVDSVLLRRFSCQKPASGTPQYAQAEGTRGALLAGHRALGLKNRPPRSCQQRGLPSG